MKVCYVADCGSKISGGHQSLLNVMAEERKLGIEPILVCHKRWEIMDAAEKMGIQTEVVPGWITVYPASKVNGVSKAKCAVKHMLNRSKLGNAVRFLKENRIDLIHFNSLLSCPLLAIAAQKCGIPYVWHIREFLKEDHQQAFPDEKYVYGLVKKSKYIIAISKSVRQKWQKEFSRPVELVYNGIPYEENYFERKEFFTGDKINLILVGRIVKGKGQMDAVKAVEELKKQGKTDYTLTLVGYRGIEPYELGVKQYIEDHGLSGQIKTMDFTYDLMEYRKNSDIGLVCSKAEAFGRVTIENMLSGLLVIGTNSGGTAELIEDGKDGMLYEVEDYKMLAEKIEWAASHREEAKKMILAGQQKASKNYVIQVTAGNIYKLYQKCV